MPVHDETARSDAANDEAATAEQLARLEAALLTLPRFPRDVFLAHRIDNLSYAEIADRTGVSVRRIEREMARAIYGLYCAMQGQPSRRRWWRW